MQIILPSAGRVPPRVTKALKATGLPFEQVDVSESDEEYFTLLSDLWDEREDFVIVEQDIVVGPNTFEDLLHCPNEWCAFTYPYLGSSYPGLGCCRFRRSLIKRRSDVFKEVAKFSNALHEPRHWCTLDHALSSELQRRGEQRCVHLGEIKHLGDNWPTHGCHGKKP